MISAIVLDSLQAATLLFIIFIENGCGVLSDKVQRPFGQRKLLSFAHCLKSVFGGFLSVKHAFLHFNRLSFGGSLKATKIRKSQDSRVFTICLPNLAESLWLPCLKSNLVRNLRLVQLVHENPKGDPNIPGEQLYSFDLRGTRHSFKRKINSLLQKILGKLWFKRMLS